MLIELYFPEVKPEFDQMMEVQKKMNRLVDGYTEQYKSGNTDGSRWLEDFQPLFVRLAQFSEDFSCQIAKLNKSTTLK